MKGLGRKLIDESPRNGLVPLDPPEKVVRGTESLFLPWGRGMVGLEGSLRWCHWPSKEIIGETHGWWGPWSSGNAPQLLPTEKSRAILESRPDPKL